MGRMGRWSDWKIAWDKRKKDPIGWIDAKLLPSGKIQLKYTINTFIDLWEQFVTWVFSDYLYFHIGKHYKERLDIDLTAIMSPPFWIYYFVDYNFRNVYYKWQKVRDDKYNWTVNYHQLQGGTLDTSETWIPRTTIQPYVWDETGHWKKVGAGEGDWSVFQQFDVVGKVRKYNVSDKIIDFNDFKKIAEKKVVFSEQLAPGLNRQNFAPGFLAGEEIEFLSGKQKGLKYKIEDNDKTDGALGKIELSSEALNLDKIEKFKDYYKKVYIWGGVRKEDDTVDPSIAVSLGDDFVVKCKYGWVKVGDLRRGKYFPSGRVIEIISIDKKKGEATLGLQITDIVGLVFLPRFTNLFKGLSLEVNGNVYEILSSRYYIDGEPYDKKFIVRVRRDNSSEEATPKQTGVDEPKDKAQEKDKAQIVIKVGDRFEIYGDRYELDSRMGATFSYDTPTYGYGLPTRAPVIGHILLSPVSVSIPKGSKIEIDSIWNPQRLIVRPYSPSGCRFSIRTLFSDRVVMFPAKTCYANFGLYPDFSGMRVFRTYTDGKSEWYKEWALMKGDFSLPSIVQGEDTRWYLFFLDGNGNLVYYALESEFEKDIEFDKEKKVEKPGKWNTIGSEQTFDLKGNHKGQDKKKIIERGVTYYDIASDTSGGRVHLFILKGAQKIFASLRLGLDSKLDVEGAKDIPLNSEYLQLVKKSSSDRFELILLGEKLYKYESCNHFDKKNKGEKIKEYEELMKIAKKKKINNLSMMCELPGDREATRISSFYAEGKKGSGVYVYNFSTGVLSFIGGSPVYRPALARNEATGRLYLAFLDENNKLNINRSDDEGKTWNKISKKKMKPKS